MSKKFNLQTEIEKYVSKITMDIMSPRKKTQIKREYADHLEDSIYRYKLLGFDEQEAFRKACEDIGEVSKIRFLLAEVHNNKLQLYLVNKILSKLRTFFTSKKFLKILFITLIIFVIAIILCITFMPFVLRFVINSIIIFTSKDFWWRIFKFLLFAVIFFTLIHLLKNLFSVLSYFFGKMFIYIKLIIICLIKRNKIIVKRLPFLSLFGLNKSGDIKIISKQHTYCLHFVDIILKYSRELTILNDDSYAVSKVLPDQLRTNGATLIDGESWFNLYVATVKSNTRNKDRIKKLPELDNQSRDIHIIIVYQNPIVKSRVTQSGIMILNDGDKLGKYINYSYKAFSRLLKRN